MFGIPKNLGYRVVKDLNIIACKMPERVLFRARKEATLILRRDPFALRLFTCLECSNPFLVHASNSQISEEVLYCTICGRTFLNGIDITQYSEQE